MAYLREGEMPPMILKNHNKAQLKNLIIDAAILDFMRRIALLLNSNIDTENLDFINGVLKDEKPKPDDITWFYKDMLKGGRLLPYCLPLLHDSPYAQTKSNFQKTRENFGSAIRDIYAALQNQIDKQIDRPTLDIDQKMVQVLLIIQIFRNETWGNILPEILAGEKISKIFTPQDKEEILEKFSKASGLIERNLDDDITVLLDRLIKKLIQMDNQYKIYFTDEPKA